MPIQTFTAADFARTAGHIGTTAMELDVLTEAAPVVVAAAVAEVTPAEVSAYLAEMSRNVFRARAEFSAEVRAAAGARLRNDLAAARAAAPFRGKAGLISRILEAIEKV